MEHQAIITVCGGVIVMTTVLVSLSIMVHATLKVMHVGMISEMLAAKTFSCSKVSQTPHQYYQIYSKFREVR